MALRGIRKHAVLAAALSVTDGAVSRWCQGGPMTAINIVALCEFLDMSADWLLLGRGSIDQHRQQPNHWPGEAALPGICERARPHLIRFLHEAISGA
jgi:transcriptional regulator with XRE-family HTH domain